MKVGESKVVNQQAPQHPEGAESRCRWFREKQPSSWTGRTPPRHRQSQPEFYIRLSDDERFGIVRLGEHKRNRVVEKLTIIRLLRKPWKSRT